MSLLGCAPKLVIAPPAQRLEVVHQFAIHTRGRSFAGLGVAVFEGERVDFVALSPAGTEIFSVSHQAGEAQITAPDPAWIPWLERLPFHRDLALVFAWSCPEGRCAVAGGRLRERRLADGSLRRTWRGPEGPVRAEIHEGQAIVLDPRRGYQVTVAGEQVHAP